MPTTAAHSDLWSLIRGTPWIDPDALLTALERECRQSPHDFRTRLLMRDAAAALSRWWGAESFGSRLSGEARAVLDRLAAEDLGEPGFPTLERRMAEATAPRVILQFLRELGDGLHVPVRLEIGGSAVLILQELLSRRTDDLDAVDEVPAPIRAEHELLDRLLPRFGLRLAHFQSHYLPTGWADRLKFLDRFGRLEVFLVDPVDIFVGKLFSKREKDRDDLRMLQDSLGRPVITERLSSSGKSLLADPILRADAQKNWYILFGDPLPA